MTIGQRIREARKARGMKQVELARKMGISQVSIARIELDYHAPMLSTLERIAAAMDMEVEVILKDKKTPPQVRSGRGD